MPTLPPIDYSRRDLNQIREHMKDFVVATRPELATDLFEGNLGSMLTDLLALSHDIQTKGQDAIPEMIFPATSRRYDPMLRFARSMGYTPTSARSATVLVETESLPTILVNNAGTIAKGSSILGANGLPYEVIADVTIGPAQFASLALREGKSLSEVFTPTRSPNQEFVTAQGVVEDSSWAVYVGDPSIPSNRWTQVDNVFLETTPSHTYQVSFDGDGRLKIQFGDGTAGLIPNQTVTLQYRITHGSAGNAPAGGISGGLPVTVVTGSGTSVVSVAVLNGSSPATGGTDRESVDSLRKSLPAFVASNNGKCVGITNYPQVLMSKGIAPLAFADVPIASALANIVRVHVWDRPLGSFTASSPLSGNSSTVPYNKYAQAGAALVAQAAAYLADNRTIATVHNVFVRPPVATVTIDLGTVSYDRAARVADVHKAIVEAVVVVFEEGDGFSVRVADLYEAIRGVAGVRYFVIQRMEFSHLDFETGNIAQTDVFALTPTVGQQPIQDITIPSVAVPKFFDDLWQYNNAITYGTDVSKTSVQAIVLGALTFDLLAS